MKYGNGHVHYFWFQAITLYGFVVTVKLNCEDHDVLLDFVWMATLKVGYCYVYCIACCYFKVKVSLKWKSHCSVWCVVRFLICDQYISLNLRFIHATCINIPGLVLGVVGIWRKDKRYFSGRKTKEISYPRLYLVSPTWLPENFLMEWKKNVFDEKFFLCYYDKKIFLCV